MKYWPIAVLISLAVIAVGAIQWVQKGDAKYGIDFHGGTELVVNFDKPTNVGVLRDTLDNAGFKGAVIQRFEETAEEFSIRVRSEEGNTASKKVREALKNVKDNSFTVQKDDYVGPIIGDQIRKDGLTALGLSFVMLLIYITVRFEFSFALGAIVAVVHDVLVATSLFLVSGRELSSAALAALLTILGYSLNDTIVIYDRVRENSIEFGKNTRKDKAGKDFSLASIMNLSLNQTMSRTILTSLTTLFVSLTLLFFGGGAISDLAFTLVVGIVSGTYSTVFIACPVVLLCRTLLHQRK